MSVSSVPISGPASGLANVQARIAAIQSQIAAVAAPRMAPSALASPGVTGATPATTTTGGSFAAALNTAVDRQGLVSNPASAGSPALPALPALIGPAVLGGASLVAPPTATPAWGMPVEGRLSSPFGHRYGVAGRGNEFNTGLDIAAPNGTPVRASASGVVKSAGPAGNYGNTVVIDHGNGVMSRYAHNSTLAVKQGQHVRAGETISAVGSTGRSTGPHLHFEVMVNGEQVDPAKWIKKQGVQD